MTIAHVEPIGGAAGNMLLGALVDCGADLTAIEAALRTLVDSGWQFACSRTTRQRIAATYLEIVVDGEGDRFDGRPSATHGRHLDDIVVLIERSDLTGSQKERAIEVYRALGTAEARAHGTTLAQGHFHEVGAIDAILDVAGFIVACDQLEISSLTCGPIPIGSGEIDMTHGRYPNPPPATAALLLGVPTFDAKAPGELVTPTAAALLTTLCNGFGPRPASVATAIGYGAGSRDGALPNVTRITIGRAAPASSDAVPDDVRILEANIDDMSPQYFELALERLFAAGALDVWLTPITMKKGRPAIVIAALTTPENEAACAHVLLRETTTIGVRVRSERRYVLPREMRLVDTPFGPIRVKEVGMNGTRRTTPEYDDVVRVARERNEPIHVIARALQAALDRR